MKWAKHVATTAVISVGLLGIPINTMAATDTTTTSPTPSLVNVMSYNHQVKVNLTHLGDVTVTVHGSYQLTNLDNKKVVPINGPIDMPLDTDSSGNLWIHETSLDQASHLGFFLQEVAGTTGNYLTLTTTASKSIDYRGSLEFTSNGLFNVLDLEDYLKGVVPREMPASWPAEALQAQSIAARNYAYKIMLALPSGWLYDDTRNQMYGGKSAEDPRSNAAVQATSGMVMYYGSMPISAYFSASNGGHTAKGSEVWSTDLPYLPSKPDPYDSYHDPYYGWSVNASNTTIATKLGLPAGDVIVNLDITSQTTYGRAQKVTATALNLLSGQTATVTVPSSGGPDALRSKLGVRLKSTLFSIQPEDTSAQVMLGDGSVQTVSYLLDSPIMESDGTTGTLQGTSVNVQDESTTFMQDLYPTRFTFNGNGDGHGAGLSQYGAYGMAAQGKTHQQILDFYFTNSILKKMP